MALDPSIALGYRPPQINLDVPSPIHQMGQILTLRQMMEAGQQRELERQQTQMQIDAAQRAQSAQQEFQRRMLAGEHLTDTQALGILGPAAGTSYLKGQYEYRQQQIKQNEETAARWASLAGSATDTPSYNRAITQAQSEGLLSPDHAQALIAQGYNPDLVKQFQTQALTAFQQTQVAQEAEKAKREAAESAAKLANEQTQGRLRGLEYAAQTVPNDPNQWQAWLAGLQKTNPDAAALIPPQHSPEAYALVRQFGVKPTAPVPGRDIPKPADVVAQEQEIERSKARAQADPFGLFASMGVGAGAPAAGAGAPTPLAQAIASFEGFDKTGSVAQRNNNPGNLRAGPGMTGTDKQGYAIFPTVAAGWAALHDLIGKHPDLSLQEFFGGKKGVYPGYAPAADNNDPANYAATVARQLNVDPTAKLADIPGSQAVPAARLTPDMQGEAVLKALPPALAQQVKALAEGRMNLPTGRAAAAPYWQTMLELTAQYDPSFDVNNPGKRAATAKDFASGKSAQQINSLNTVIGHVASLSGAIDRLNNTRFPAVNTFANWLSTEMGNPAVKDFNTVKKAVADELTRVWRGTGGSEKDIEAWSKSLDDAGSPEQLHSVVSRIGELLESKLTALQDQYREGMGTIAQGRQMITPQSRQILDRLEARASGNAAAAAPATRNPNPGGYTPGHMYGGKKYLGGDPNNPASWQ